MLGCIYNALVYMAETIVRNRLIQPIALPELSETQSALNI